jgi:hypothetical protein
MSSCLLLSTPPFPGFCCPLVFFVVFEGFLPLDELTFSSLVAFFFRDEPRFGQTEANFCLRFGLSGNRTFGSETEEEALRRNRAEHRFCRKFFFSETQHTVVYDSQAQQFERFPRVYDSQRGSPVL